MSGGTVDTRRVCPSHGKVETVKDPKDTRADWCPKCRPDLAGGRNISTSKPEKSRRSRRGRGEEASATADEKPKRWRIFGRKKKEEPA